METLEQTSNGTVQEATTPPRKRFKAEKKTPKKGVRPAAEAILRGQKPERKKPGPKPGSKPGPKAGSKPGPKPGTHSSPRVMKKGRAKSGPSGVKIVLSKTLEGCAAGKPWVKEYLREQAHKIEHFLRSVSQ